MGPGFLSLLGLLCVSSLSGCQRFAGFSGIAGFPGLANLSGFPWLIRLSGFFGFSAALAPALFARTVQASCLHLSRNQP